MIFFYKIILNGIILSSMGEGEGWFYIILLFLDIYVLFLLYKGII